MVHYSRNLLPLQKKSMGQLRGIRSPPGLNKQEQEALLGLSSEAEASSGHDKESGAPTGSLSNRFHFRDGRSRRVHRNSFNPSCLVLSMETHLGQAAPLVVAVEAIPEPPPWTRQDKMD